MSKRKQKKRLNFGKGLLWGALIGGTTALLTSKKSGAQRRNEFSAYLNGLTTATDNVNQSVRKLRRSLERLHQELSDNAAPTVSAIKQDMTDFEFQAQPRLRALDRETTQLQADLNQLSGATGTPTTTDQDAPQ